MTKLVEVILRCKEIVVYRKKIKLSASEVAEYDAAVKRNEPDIWFSDFAARYIDPLHDAEGGDGYEDVEMTAYAER
jgi:hypothetical protein